MPSIYDIKPQFQALLRPSTRKLARSGVTANQVTIAATLLSICAGGAVYVLADHSRVLLILPGVLLIRMALNAVDGMLAREHSMESKLGAILNEVGDVVSDLALYLPLALVPGFHPTLVVLCVVLAILTEFIGVVSLQVGGTRRYDGPMGKSDRAFVFGAIALAIGFGVAPSDWLDWTLGGVAVLSVATGWNRARRALREAA